MDTAYRLNRDCMETFRRVRGNFIDTEWTLMKVLWSLYKNCMVPDKEAIWRLYLNCIVTIWRLFGDYIVTVWRLYGDCMEIVWKLNEHCITTIKIPLCISRVMV